MPPIHKVPMTETVQPSHPFQNMVPQQFTASTFSGQSQFSAPSQNYSQLSAPIQGIPNAALLTQQLGGSTLK